jgi:hypothetical protein
MMGEPNVHVLAGHLAHHLQAAQRRCDEATLS